MRFYSTLLAFSIALFSYAGAVPPLPKLPIENFASPAREQIREAYDAVLQSPAAPGSNGRLGMILYAYEHLQFAEVCFERARAFDAKDKRWIYFLGKTQAGLGKHDQAADTFRAALRQNPDYLPAQLALGESLMTAGKLDESQRIYEAALARQPALAAAFYGLGRIRAARKEFAPAVEFLRKACDLYPDFGAAHYALALAYRDLGDKAKAQEQLSQYQKNTLGWPGTPDPLLAEIDELKTGAIAHLRRGVRLEATGQMEAAAEEHERALQIDPRQVQAHVNLITLYGKLGQADKAEQHYRESVKLNPNFPESHYNYGVLLTGQRKHTEAEEAFSRALEISPHYAEAHNNYAYLLMISGRLDEAAQHYRAAIENKPNYRFAHFNLARILVNQGKNQEAIDHLIQILKPEDQETPSYIYALAAAYARAGNREKALVHMRDARQRAAALGQSVVLSSIEKDLKILERGTNPP